MVIASREEQTRLHITATNWAMVPVLMIALPASPLRSNAIRLFGMLIAVTVIAAMVGKISTNRSFVTLTRRAIKMAIPAHRVRSITVGITIIMPALAMAMILVIH